MIAPDGCAGKSLFAALEGAIVHFKSLLFAG
jgi:hypothetical protein